MQYRIAVYADDLGQWVQVGPVFDSFDDAVRFLERFATPFKRLVQVPAQEEVELPKDDGVVLDPRRLEFVRFLIRTGRISEQLQPARQADLLRQAA